MSALGNLVVSLSLDYAEFTKGIDKSSYEAQRFAQKLDRDVNRALKQSGDYFKGAAASAAAAVAGFLAIESAAGKLTQTFTRMDDAVKAAAKVGIAVDELTALQYAADLSGLSVEGLQNGLKLLSKNAVEAAGGAREQVEAFAALGISVSDANGKLKPTTTLLGDLAEAFSGLSDGAVKSALAQKIFGKSGADLIPFLNSGREGLEELTDEARKFGVAIGADGAKQAEVFNDNLSRLKAASDGLFIKLANDLLPTLVSLSDKLVGAAKSSGNLGDAFLFLFRDSLKGGDIADKFRAANAELEKSNRLMGALLSVGEKLENLPFGSGIKSFAGERQRQAANDAKIYSEQLNGVIDGINKPPTDSAAARQLRDNQAAAKAAADDLAARTLRESEARKKAEAELEQLAKKYADYTAAIKAKITAAQLEVDFAGSADLPIKKLELSLLADLQKAKNGNVAVTAREREEIEKLLDIERQRIDIAAQRAASNFIADEVDAIDARRRAVDGELEQIAFERASIGQTAEAIAQMTYRRDLDAIAALEEERNLKSKLPAMEAVVEALDREIEKRKELADARLGLANGRAAQSAIEKDGEAYKAFFGDVSRGLTDALFRGFENGKKAFSNFKDVLKNAFKTLVLKVAVQPILGSVVGGAVSALGLSPGIAKAANESFGLPSGGVGGAGGSGVSLSDFSSLKSVYDLVSKGFAGISGSVTNGIVRLGDYLATSSNSTLASAGDFINSGATSANGGVAGAAGGVAAYGAGIAGGYAINRGLAGGYEVGGAVGNIAKNGALIGAIFGGPVGALIGGAIGGAVNGLFGKKTVLGAGGIEGTFSDDGFAGRTFQDVTVKRRFRSDRNSTSYGSVPTETLDAFAQTLMGISKAAKSAGLALGRDLTKGIETFSLSGRFTGSFESIANTVADAMVKSALSVYDQTTTRGTSGFARLFSKTTTKEVGTAENLAFLGYLRELKTASENLLQVMVRVAGAVTDANSAAILLGQGIQFSIANAREAMSFQSVLGDLTKNLESVLSSFIPAADLAARRVALMDEQLSNLGLDGLVSVKTTREEFGKLLQSRNITTEAGQRELALLLQIAPAMDSIIRQREDELNAIKQNILAQRQAVIDLFTGFADGIAQTRASLAAARNNTPEGTQSAFFDALTNVRSGNVDERAFGLSQISGAASAYLESATAAANSSLDAARIYGVVQSALIESENIARATADVQTLQLDALNAIAGGIIDVKNAILNGTDTNTVPGFANGGMFGGGLRMVGERGPELEITGPSRIIPNNQLSDVFGGGDNGKTADEVRALRQDMRASQAQMAAVNQKMLKILARWDADGQPEIRVVA